MTTRMALAKALRGALESLHAIEISGCSNVAHLGLAVGFDVPAHRKVLAAFDAADLCPHRNRERVAGNPVCSDCGLEL